MTACCREPGRNHDARSARNRPSRPCPGSGGFGGCSPCPVAAGARRPWRKPPHTPCYRVRVAPSPPLRMSRGIQTTACGWRETGTRGTMQRWGHGGARLRRDQPRLAGVPVWWVSVGRTCAQPPRVARRRWRGSDLGASWGRKLRLSLVLPPRRASVAVSTLCTVSRGLDHALRVRSIGVSRTNVGKRLV